jgi:hypothetical protein
MYITRHQYSIERLPEATVGGGIKYVPVANSVNLSVLFMFSVYVIT